MLNAAKLLADLKRLRKVLDADLRATHAAGHSETLFRPSGARLSISAVPEIPLTSFSMAPSIRRWFLRGRVKCRIADHPPARSENGKAHTLPLSPMMREVIAAVPHMATRGAHGDP
jgi:hypothetical protein